MPVKKKTASKKAPIKKTSKKKISKNKKHTHDIIVIGDATLDQYLRLNEASVLCNIHKNTCLLCLNYADKIPVEEMDSAVGGNAANVAVGASKFGLKSALYTELGNDETGLKIKNELTKHKVSPNYIKVQKGAKSNFSAVIKYEGERTILTYHSKKNYSLPKLAPARFMYLTSMSKGSDKLYPDILAYVERHDVKLCFGPGTFQRKSGLRKLKKILQNTYCYISNKEEAMEIFSYPQPKDVKEVDFMKLLLKKVHVGGPDIVVLTDARKGAYAFDGLHYYHMPIVETIYATYPTGAGDAFSSGLLSGLMNGKTVDIALEWGTYNSTGVIQKMGPHNGLLNKAELKRSQDRFKLKARKI